MALPMKHFSILTDGRTCGGAQVYVIAYKWRSLDHIINLSYEACHHKHRNVPVMCSINNHINKEFVSV